MPTEFNDDVHYGLFFGGGALNSSTSFKVRQSELTLAALRSAGFLDNMVDGLVPPTTDKLWLDKNTDPAILKEYNPVGAAWEQVTSQTLFGRVPFRGPWDDEPIYRRGDLVFYNGSIWIAVQASQNHPPAEDAYWDVFIDGGSYVQRSLNLSDLASIGTAQDNIQVGATFADIATAQSATVAARNKRIRLQYRTSGRLLGSGFDARRISLADLTGYPTASYFRSTDRLMPDESTDATNGGYWVIDETVVSNRQLGCVADGSVDDTAACLATFQFGMKTGRTVAFHGTTRITTDLTLTGSGSTLSVIGNVDSKIVAAGASKLTLAGSFELVDLGVQFEDFSYSTLWLADEVDIETLRLRGVKNSGSIIFLSAQGDPTAANYTSTRYYVPNADTRIGYLEISGCDISDGVAGVYLPIVVESADIYNNHVHDLQNSLDVGSSLDRRVTAFTIGPLGGTVGGDFGAVGTNYSPDYDRIKHLSVRDNRIENLTQNVVTKGVNSIALNGQNCLVTGNRISNQLSPGGVDSADGNNNDNEAIYTKAKNTVIGFNTLKNAGSSECAINVKSFSRAITDFTGTGDQPGYGNLVIGNIAEWDIAPADRTVFCAIHAGPTSVIGNRAIGLTGVTAVMVHGIGSPYTVNEYPIIIDDNYFEGTHGAMVIQRGGVEALTIGPGNINNIIGGNGNCAYFEVAQSRGQNYKNISVAGKHKVRNRTGAVAYNAVVRAGSNLFPINGLLVEGMIADHVDASNTGSVYKGLWLQDATNKVRDLVWRNNRMPDGLFGQQVFDIALGDVEWEFDGDMSFTTLGAAPTQAIFNTRCAEDSAVVIEVDAAAFDAIGTAGTCDAAAYHKKGVYKREGSGNLAVVGSAVTLLEAESDATWACAPSVNVLFAVVSVTGDATNPTRWKARIKSRIAKSP